VAELDAIGREPDWAAVAEELNRQFAEESELFRRIVDSAQTMKANALANGDAYVHFPFHRDGEA
jgi:hypothetical protein